MNLIAFLGAFLLFSLGLYIVWDDGNAVRCLYGGLDLLTLGMILGGLPASWPWRNS